MNVAYDLTIDDFVDFNLNHQRRSPILRAITLSIFIVPWVAILIGVAFYLLSASRDSTSLDTSNVAFLILWAAMHFLVFGFLVFRIVRRGWSNPVSALLIRRMLTEGDTVRVNNFETAPVGN